MTRTSRAAVLVEPEQFELREFEIPSIGPDEALVRIEACGICGSDYEQFHGNTETPTPVIPGHEPLGIVEEIGERAAARHGVVPGDRVAVRARYGCGDCAACARQDYDACRNGGEIGFTHLDRQPHLWGGYADYLYIPPAINLRKMRSDLPARVAVLFNPLSAGFDWCVATPELQPGDDVVVLGCGQRGLACLLAARASGAGRVVVTGLSRDAHKLALAREFGADLTIDVERDDLVETVMDFTDGEGARVVVDVTPMATESVLHAIAIAAWEGSIVLAGFKAWRTVEGFQSDAVAMKRLTLRGVRATRSVGWEPAIRFIEETDLPLDKLSTHAFELADAESAVRTLAGDYPDEQAINVAIVPERG